MLAAAAAAKLLQSCQTLCNPIDSSPPGSSIPGILQARTLEWVAISFSNAWKWKVKVKSLSCVQLLATHWTYQGPTRPLCPWDFAGKSTGVGTWQPSLLLMLKCSLYPLWQEYHRGDGVFFSVHHIKRHVMVICLITRDDKRDVPFCYHSLRQCPQNIRNKSKNKQMGPNET